MRRLSNMELVQTDSDGRSWTVWIQQFGASCGPACIYMLDHLRGGIPHLRTSTPLANSEKPYQTLSASYDGGYDGQYGATADNLARCMREIGLPGRVTNANIRDFIKDLGHFPFVAQVRIIDQGSSILHATVVAALTSTKKLVCLDPFLGLVEIPSYGLPAYFAATNVPDPPSQVTFVTGHFTGVMMLGGTATPMEGPLRLA